MPLSYVSFLSRVAGTQCVRYGLLLHMSHVVWSVCVHVCWAHGWAVQKRLNRSTCRLRADLRGPKKPRIRWGSRSPNRKGQFWVLSSALESIGCLSCNICSKKNNKILNNGMTAGLLQPTAVLSTDRCHIAFLPVKNPPLRCGILSKFFDHLLFLLLRVVGCVHWLTSQTQVSGWAMECILVDRAPAAAAAAEYPSAERRPATDVDGDEVSPRRKWRCTTAAAAAAAAATAAASPGPETADVGVSFSTTSCLMETVVVVISELLVALLVAVVVLLNIASTAYHLTSSSSSS